MFKFKSYGTAYVQHTMRMRGLAGQKSLSHFQCDKKKQESKKMLIHEHELGYGLGIGSPHAHTR